MPINGIAKKENRGAKKAITKFITEFIFEYETPKIVAINSVRIGLIYRFLQLSIIAYIIGYAIIYNKGYQTMEAGQSTITTKVKGISSSLHRTDLSAEYLRVWDYADYIVPPMAKDSLFIMTTAILTPNQTVSLCAEAPDIKDGVCVPNERNCTEGEPVKFGNGVKTGQCIQSNWKKSTFACEIQTWCPLENDTVIQEFKEPLLTDFENFTIFIKNAVEFPEFQVKRRNVDSIKHPSYVKNCSYHPDKDPFCPIFKVRDILRLANVNPASIAIEGGIINVLIRWDCNLDYKLSHCHPTFTFSQMDEATNKFSVGFNFRFAHYYRVDGVLTRDLTKAYGILFVFNADAQARKFNIVQLSMNVGAGLALLGVASVLMDMLLTNISRDRQFYKDQKFINLNSTKMKEEKRRKSQPIAHLNNNSLDPMIKTEIEEDPSERTRL